MTRLAATTSTIATVVAAMLAARPVAASPWSIPARAWSRAAISHERERPVLRAAETDEDASADAARREAAAAFVDGENAFERGEYRVAAIRFEHAHRLSPHAWTLYNLALSRARSGDPLGAWRAFDELAGRGTTEVERSEAARERDALQPLLAVVIVRGPIGARACLDEVAIAIESATPVERVVLPGAHRITTPTREHEVVLEAGTRTQVDAAPHVAPRDRVRPWLIAGTSAASVATIGAVAGAATAPNRTTQALTGAAAGLGAAAVVFTIVALVRRSRERPAAPPELRCTAPATKQVGRDGPSLPSVGQSPPEPPIPPSLRSLPSSPVNASRSSATQNRPATLSPPP